MSQFFRLKFPRDFYVLYLVLKQEVYVLALLVASKACVKFHIVRTANVLFYEAWLRKNISYLKIEYKYHFHFKSE